MDVVSKIIEYETEGLTEEDMIEFFQYLLDTGILFSLQGNYRKTGGELLEAGLIARK